MVRKFYRLFLLIVTVILFCIGCSGTEQQKSESEEVNFKIDSSNLLMKYNNNVFSLPSPYQVSMLLRKVKYKFNKELLVNRSDTKKLSTSIEKALELGVIGADMAYLMIYNRPEEAIEYFYDIKSLSEELGLLSVAEEELEEYIFDPNQLDSLILKMSSLYGRMNAYLMDNERNEIGSLIITGGWIESMYFLTKINIEKKNYLISNRIGEQKRPLESLIDILSPYYYKEKIYSQLIDRLVDLAYEFDGIICTYQYEPPIIDEKNKLTIINSESNVVLSEYHLKSIAEKIEEIRNSIVK